jgi:hypothetical protein
MPLLKEYSDGSTERIQPKRVHHHDGQVFDSTFEYKVYQELCLKFGADNVKRQYKILIKPATELFPALFWKADFFCTKGVTEMIVEAKGHWDTEFTRTIKYLEYFDPLSFDKLIVICPRCPKRPPKGVSVYSFVNGFKLIDDLIRNF